MEPKRLSTNNLYFIVMTATIAAAIPIIVYLILTGGTGAGEVDRPESPERPESAREDLERLDRTGDVFRDRIRIRVQGRKLFDVTEVRKGDDPRRAKAAGVEIFLPRFFLAERPELDDAVARLFATLPSGTGELQGGALTIHLAMEGREGRQSVEAVGVVERDESSFGFSAAWAPGPKSSCSVEFIRTARTGLLFIKYQCPERQLLKAAFLPADLTLSFTSLTLTSSSYLEVGGLEIKDEERDVVFAAKKVTFSSKKPVEPELFALGLPHGKLARREGWEIVAEGVSGEASRLHNLPMIQTMTGLPEGRFTADRLEASSGGNIRFMQLSLAGQDGVDFSAMLASCTVEEGSRVYSLEEPVLKLGGIGATLSCPSAAIELDRFGKYFVRFEGYSLDLSPNPLAAARYLGWISDAKAMATRLTEAKFDFPPLVVPFALPDLKLTALNGEVRFPVLLKKKATGVTINAVVTGGMVEKADARLCLGKASCSDLELSAGVVTDSVGNVSQLNFSVAGTMPARKVAARYPDKLRGMERLDLNCKSALIDGVRKVKIECETSVHGLTVFHKKLAAVPLHIPLLRLQGEARLDLVEQKLELSLPKMQMGEVFARASVDVDRIFGVPAFRVKVDFPEQSCAALLRSVPDGFAPILSETLVEGSLWFDTTFEVDLKDVRRTLELSIDGDMERCRAITLGHDLNVLELNHPEYTHQVVVKGEDLGIVVGPGSGAYVPLDQVPKHVQAAAYGTEDLNFFTHNGFRVGLIRRALILLFERGRFAYGGSTISQQLVKNLFLTREKTLSRKFQEAVIVWEMERQVPKDRIFELYLNCIEYGPKIWGIARASRVYFGKHPTQLKIMEGAFLMGLKPDPAYGYLQYRRGKLNSHWRKNLDRVLKRLLDMGAISQANYDLTMRMRLQFKPKGGAPAPATDLPEEDRPVREGQEEL